MVVVGILAGGSAGAQDGFRRLDAGEIRARFTGRELTDQVHWRYLFRTDGTLESVSLGRRGAGTWTVTAGQLCMIGGPGTSPCHEVWMSGDDVQLRPDTGLAPEEGILRRP